MYPYFYRLLQSFILKKSFNDDLIKLINKHDVKEIIDIGSADSTILKYIGKNYYYHGFELNSYFTNKLNSKYKNNEQFKFYNLGIDEIDFSKFSPNNSLIVMVGLFHHINDFQINKFIEKTKSFKIFAIDAVKIIGQKRITKLLMSLDKGNYIRQIEEYKKILPNYDFLIAKNRYLRFPYDHLISTNNIDKNIINDVFK